MHVHGIRVVCFERKFCLQTSYNMAYFLLYMERYVAVSVNKIRWRPFGCYLENTYRKLGHISDTITFILLGMYIREIACIGFHYGDWGIVLSSSSLDKKESHLWSF